MFRLGLIQGALLVSVLTACLWPRVRPAALFCATLVLGGLLAFVGQTYQTGADAWQLFAVWAALALIWVSLSRSDWLWLLWVLIAATGLAMWTGRFDLWDGRFDGPDSQTQALLNMALWLLLAVVPALVLALVGRWVAQDIGVESFLIFGLIAMGCLGLSVRWLMGVHRQLRAQEVAQ